MSALSPPSCKPLALMPPPPEKPALVFSVTFTTASTRKLPGLRSRRGFQVMLAFSSPAVLMRSFKSSSMRP